MMVAPSGEQIKSLKSYAKTYCSNINRNNKSVNCEQLCKIYVS